MLDLGNYFTRGSLIGGFLSEMLIAESIKTVHRSGPVSIFSLFYPMGLCS